MLTLKTLLDCFFLPNLPSFEVALLLYCLKISLVKGMKNRKVHLFFFSFYGAGREGRERGETLAELGCYPSQSKMERVNFMVEFLLFYLLVYMLLCYLKF